MKNFKILITGKNGFIGSILSNSILNKKYSLLSLERKHEKYPNNCECSNRYYCECSLPEKVDYCIHLGGASVSAPFYSDEYQDILYDSHVVATRELLYTIAPKLNSLKHVFIASSASIYGDRGDEELTENSSISKENQNFLNTLLIDKEESVRSYLTSDFTILRFGIVIDNPILQKRLKLFNIFRLRDGKQHIATISSENLVNIIDHLITNPAINTPVNLVDSSLIFKERFRGVIPLLLPDYIINRSIVQNLVISTNIRSTILADIKKT